MIIKKLIMHNFGVYASTNILEFKSDKPVVLIGGMNGRGKTTILEAVLLSLYGANSFAFIESKYATYGQYLRSYVNKADGTFYTYVDIEFTMDASEEEVYFIHREWDANGQRVRERIMVKKNDVESIFLTENWPMFVENILPSALSNFFFFDGEKIAELAVEDTSGKMKESIKAMLGITVLDVLKSDLKKIISRLSKDSSLHKELKELDELKMKKDEAERNLAEADEKIAQKSARLDEINMKYEKLLSEYAVMGGGIIEQKNDLMSQRTEHMAALSASQDQLLDLAAGEMPFMLVRSLLYDIQAQGIMEHEHKLNRLALDKVRQLYKSFTEKSDVLNTFMDYVQDQMKPELNEGLYNLSDADLFRIEMLNKSSLDLCVNKARELIGVRENSKKKIEEIDNSLSVDIDEKGLNELFDKIKMAEKEIGSEELQYEMLEKARVSLHGAYITAESEFNRYAENVLSSLEAADSAERTVKYAHMAERIMNLYQIKLQERKADLLAGTMTDCYKKLANKKNLVSKIIMDGKTLDLHYINDEGDEVAKKRLSAGEKQLMVISLLWALAICSKKKLPVIIDTPLSRLDSIHRQALIKTYFPNASDQTIILSTDSEIDENYYDLIKENVGDKFTLIYSDLTKRTAIKRGYFGWGAEI